VIFERILVGLDGSDGAKRALSFAEGLARRDGAELVLAHVEQLIVGKGGGPIRVDEEDVVAELRAEARRLESEGIQAEVETASEMLGGPAPVLAAIADRTGADLIVVGTRGHSALAGVLLGSVVQRLLHLAHQPVLAVPEESRGPREAHGDQAEAEERSAAAPNLE
jgi:nucleotide-binding universal stress UspA family protein